jgi:hypothetical protein
MQGSSDGPVSFHYPAGDYVGALLDGGDISLPGKSAPSRAAAPAADAFEVRKPGGRP